MCFAHAPANSFYFQATRITSHVEQPSTVAINATCNWDKLSVEERAKIWPTLSQRHRDYHWRLLSPKDRHELRAHLTKEQKRELRERYISRGHHQGQRMGHPYVLYKRLSKAELTLLRLQVQQAIQQQITEGSIKTPAQLEHEDQFLSSLARLNDHTHQMLIVTVTDGPIETPAEKIAEAQSAAEAAGANPMDSQATPD